MKRIVVAGTVNIEFNLQVDAFPLLYVPGTFASIPVDVSGVGFNISSALEALGTPVTFMTLLGDDALSQVAEQVIRDRKLWGDGIVRFKGATPHAIVLHDRDGRRSIFTDLAHISDYTYPDERVPQLLEDSACAIVTNAGFTRSLLHVTRKQGLLTACDIHMITDLDDSYNYEYMNCCDILFMSGERLPVSPLQWLDMLMDKYSSCQIAVVGMGHEGCCIKIRGEPPQIITAVTPRPVVNSIGAGDALFASFMHYYVQGRAPLEAIKRAVIFAGWKIGTSGGSEGFLSSSEVEELLLKGL